MPKWLFLCGLVLATFALHFVPQARAKDPETPAVAAAAATATEQGRVRRTLSACVRWFNFPQRARDNYDLFKPAMNRRIVDYFPNHANQTVDASGRVVNYSADELKEFKKAVDLYFSFQIGPQNLDGLRDFRSWLKEQFGSAYPPLHASDIQSWIRENPEITLIQVMRNFFDRFVDAKFTVATPTDTNTPQYTARAIAGRAATGARHVGKWFGENVLMTARFVMFGAIVSVGTMGITGALPEWVRTAPTQAQTATRDLVTGRTALHDAYRELYALIETSQRATYGNTAEDLERWSAFENNFFNLATATSREAQKFRETIPLPQQIRNLNVELRLRYDRNSADLARASSTLTQLQGEIARLGEGNSPEVAERRANLGRQLASQENLVRNLSLARASFLAEWKLNNLLLRANKLGRAANASPEPGLEAENVLINQEIEQLRAQGLFSYFVTATNELTKRFQDELKRAGYGH
jgi:hypothetical protein